MNADKNIPFRRASFPLLLGCLAGVAQAQSFTLEGAVIDSRNSRNLGVVTESGQINSVFRAQKAMTFGILRSAGISLDQLPADVRARIERLQTSNVEAFRAFSLGLDLKDQGKFVEAREQFRRATELDPGFTLAAEQQRAMPDANLGTAVQTRAVIAAASNAAVERGKASFTIDLARAVAAISAGLTVVVTTTPTTEQATTTNNGFTTNQPGAGGQLQPNLAAGISYSYVTASGSQVSQVSLASSGEYIGSHYERSGGVLNSLSSSDGVLAERKGAAVATPIGSTLLSDGTTTAYWGTWLSTASASARVVVSGKEYTAPLLGNVDYVIAEATRQMPTQSTVTFTPRGGSLNATAGSIQVNFATQAVSLQDLGFSIGSLTFSGLRGDAKYDTRIASGGFTGNYTAGSCTGCALFTATSSSFSGNFIGRDANGLVFSTLMNTGSGTASGVHVFGRP